MFDNQNNAQNVLLDSTNQSFTGAVSNYDASDYYKLQVNSRSNLNLSLSGVSSDVNLYLFDNNSNLVSSSTNLGNVSESIKTTLDVGTYFAKVDRSILNDNLVSTISPYKLSFTNDPLFNNATILPVNYSNVNLIYTIGSDGINNINAAFIDTYNQVSGSQVLGKAIDNIHSITGGTIQNFERGSIFQSAAGTYALQGSLNTLYNNLSAGDKQKLGLPTANETSVGGYWHQAFQNGEIQLVQGTPVKWSNETLINDRFNLLGGTNTLGQSIGSISNVNGVPVQNYAKGSIFILNNSTIAVTGSIATYYSTNSGTLGFPTSDEVSTSYGKSQTFQGGLVTSSTQFGVNIVRGSLVGYYSGLTAAQKDQLGAATTGEAVGGDGNWQQFFKGGSVLWKSNGTGELKLTSYTIGFDGTSLNSAFTTKFNQVVGWTALGQPIGNVVSFNGGKLQDFAQGTICQLGNNVFTLRGQIGLRARDEIGTFGLPTSEQITTSYGTKQEFQNGLVMQAGAGVNSISGNIWNYYRGLSATQQNQLGNITSLESLTSDGSLQQSFKGGTVFWKKDGTGEVKFGSANIAPQAPLVYGAKASYDANSTLTLGSSYAWDGNGWQDISKVDFWLTNAQGGRIELADATSFVTYNQNYAKFNYSTSLSGIAIGDYKLNAVAYDRAGVASNQFSQALAIKAPNFTPLAPLVYGAKASYDANSTLTLGTSYAWDSNGWQDISKVDFWLTNAQGGRIELADATSFTTYNQNYAKFNYSTSLSGIAIGDYKLNAVAYDKSGAASNRFSQSLAIKAPANIAPLAPLVYGAKASYDANSTLTLGTSYAWDSNGWQDISKVDFWLTNAQGGRIELADATSFTTYNQNYAKFNYSTSLSGIAVGDYKLNAVAYDKSGAASNQFSQSLSIKAPNIAPQAPLVYGVKSSYDANATLTVDSGYAYDNNGWQDISKVDFWLTNTQGQRIELADASGFAAYAYDPNYAQFQYNTSLSGIAIGDYTLNAVAYDKAGATSNQFSQAFTIKAANIAPGDMIVNGIQSSYDANSTININNGYAWDNNGWQDLNKVDFWLINSQNQRIELTDVTNFIYNSQNWAEFTHSINLSGIASGEYKLQAVAYDKAGTAGNQFSQALTIKAANVAPNAPLVYGVQSNYDANSTLSLSSGYIWDDNGWQDINKVDFWLTNSQNQRIELADVTSFSANAYDRNYAQFNYSASLNGFAVGDYSLNAIAYDKAGIASNQFSQLFKISSTKDWFELNLKDSGVINLSRSKAADGKLDRNDMLSIFSDMKDGGVVDTYEISDLKSLIATTTPFSMSDPVRYLSNKVATSTYANISTTNFEVDLGKWFLGTVAPTARFTNESNGTVTNFTYTRFTGSLFGNSNSARIGGIDQRSFGDCVLLASLGATFAPQSNDAGNSISQTINEMLIDNGDNTYTVRFFSQDLNNKALNAEWVTVDNRLATTNGLSLFGASNENGLWMPIIEKAYAQWREFNEGSTFYADKYASGWDIIGNGDNLISGLQRITGRVATYYSPQGQDFDFSFIQNSLSLGKAITAAGAPSNNTLNLIDNHAYSVTNAYINANGEQRVVVRNPWGIDYDWNNYTDGSNDGFRDLSYEQFRTFGYIAVTAYQLLNVRKM